MQKTRKQASGVAGICLLGAYQNGRQPLPEWQGLNNTAKKMVVDFGSCHASAFKY